MLVRVAQNAQEMPDFVSAPESDTNGAMRCGKFQLSAGHLLEEIALKLTAAERPMLVDAASTICTQRRTGLREPRPAL
jgi:hypothetical protein